jgi:hypothetical protein
MLVQGEMAQLVSTVKPTMLGDLYVLRNTNGVPPFHIENASTSLHHGKGKYTHSRDSSNWTISN